MKIFNFRLIGDKFERIDMSASNSGTSAASAAGIAGGGGGGTSDQSQITHVLNKDKKYLSEHGQKLFNAINCLLDDNEQLELTQSLFKYQRDHNVFTLVRSCRELFDTPKKKVYTTKSLHTKSFTNLMYYFLNRLYFPFYWLFGKSFFLLLLYQ